ncbi:type IX secretion system ring subunit PorN/GldN [Lutibacter sp.]
MINKRNIGIFILAFVLFNTVHAQSNLLNATRPSDIGKKTAEQLAVDNDKPLEYGYIGDRDILWSKVVWEYIDLNERINLPMYYPVDTTSISGNRRSLFDTLLRGIKSNEITEVYDDSYFTAKMTKAEINSKLYRIDTTEAGYDELNAGTLNIDEYVDKINLTSQDIEGFKIKGLWYFDKRQGELKYRLLALAPVAPDVQTMGRDDVVDATEKLALFWVWFPDARKTLHEMKVFNNKNSAYPISFDHLLNARRFSSIIFREENIYGNRDVADYVKGNALFQVIESNKIKDEIRNKELDMWNY